MRVRVVAWDSDLALLLEAGRDLGIDLKAWSASDLEDEEALERCTGSLEEADLILLHPAHGRPFDHILERIPSGVPVVSFGIDPSLWTHSNVGPRVVSTVNAYVLYGGAGNIRNMLCYLAWEVLGRDLRPDLGLDAAGGADGDGSERVKESESERVGGSGSGRARTVCEPPKETMWQGIYHPDAGAPGKAFPTVEEYLEWYGSVHEGQRPAVGILFFRTYWANGDLSIVDALIRELERDFCTIPAFCFGMGDKDLGAMSSGQVVEEFFTGRVKAVVNLQSIFHAGSVEDSVRVLKGADVPVLHPLTVYHKTEEEWHEDVHGMNSAEMGWSLAMPEMGGLIEPVLAGAAFRGRIGEAGFERHAAVPERIAKIARRVGRWVRLQEKPPGKRKVAIMIHNNPCASAEATVGSAAHLDTLESVARILWALKEEGYDVDPPEDGRALVEDILDKKAISEFRWTSVEEIVHRGGALALISGEEYKKWFDTLPEEARRGVCDAWGDPPGEEKEGVPPAMVYDGKMVVTGVGYGSAVVCVQPKRGCAGARCDGQACRILHDPEVPPPHQYLATYRYLQEDFGADVMIHVGTHGNLEFLPGKSAALSGACYPDIGIGDVPYLYVYNSDNPPEGTVAKRRSYAVLVDHMQTVMTSAEAYGELKELEEKIAEYHRTMVSERARAHATKHVILDLLKSTGLDEEMALDEMVIEEKMVIEEAGPHDAADSGAAFEAVLERAHDKISEIYTTQIPDGMHVFGEVPSGQRRVEMIASILRYGREVERTLGTDKNADPGVEPVERPSGEDVSTAIISAVLKGTGAGEAALSILGMRAEEISGDLQAGLVGDLPGDLTGNMAAGLAALEDRIKNLDGRIEASREMDALLHAMDGGYVEPGPSGLITRGKPEVLPTGRNFYTLDPRSVPTKAAWRVGRRLAEALLDRYEEENGRLPENVAMYWMASDIMWADGEQLAQMFSLMGVEPLWRGGRLDGYRITPLEEMARPRIDLTVRVSGITRDCFYNCIELLDMAMRDVASLDEPPGMNFLRKHGQAPRIFASRPGTYGNGVNLAVYASAWEDDSDLTDVFVQWNGYAYGKDSFGQESRQALVDQLGSVDLTFNKTVTDEYDLLGCCCYFGTHGGLTNAAQEISGHKVNSYYGDTRDPGKVDVRTLADEVRRVVRAKLLNPRWIEGMKRHGYKGAGDISKGVGRVYGWEATTKEVDDHIFDDMAKTFVLDDEMRRFFEENNPWALEEIGRRLLEANQRGLWDADEDVLEGLKAAYLEIEGWMEDRCGEGDFQGGTIDVIPAEEAGRWREKISGVLRR